MSSPSGESLLDGRPALAALLGADGQVLGVFYGPGSGSCSPCPFATVDASAPYEPNPHDPDEGHYACALLDRSGVWGESPVCTGGDWQRRALDELHEIAGSRTAGSSEPDPAERKAAPTP